MSYRLPVAPKGASGGSGSAPSGQPDKKLGIPLFVLIGATIFAVALAVFALIKQTVSYRAHDVVVQEYTRDAMSDSALVIPVDELLGEENKLRFYEGHGARIILRMLHNPRAGYATTVDTLVIEKWKKFEQTDPPVRRSYVKYQAEEIRAKIKQFLAHQPVIRYYEVYVDDTEGITPALREQVEYWVSRIQIPQILARGDKVNVNLCRLTDTDFINCRIVELAPATRADDQFALQQAMNWLLAPRSGVSASSIATGLFNFLKESSAEPMRKVLVFSDGLENSARTISFYTDPAAVTDSTRWEQTASALQAYEKIPPLNEVRIEWYAPQRDQGQGALIRRALAFWENILSKQGAEVRVHY